jgi:WD40 repeat protein
MVSTRLMNSDAHWIEFHPRDNWLAFADTREEMVYVLDLETQEMLYSLRTDVEGSLSRFSSVSDLKWSPDGKYLAYSMPKGIFIWNGDTGEEIMWFASENPPLKITWSPDSTRLAASTMEDELIFWSMEALSVEHSMDLSNRLTGTDDGFGALAWAMSQSLIAYSTTGGEILIIDTNTYDIVSSIEYGTRGIFHISWIDNDEKLIFGSNENAIVKWDLTSATVVDIIMGAPVHPIEDNK